MLIFVVENLWKINNNQNALIRITLANLSLPVLTIRPIRHLGLIPLPWALATYRPDLLLQTVLYIRS